MFALCLPARIVGRVFSWMMEQQIRLFKLSVTSCVESLVHWLTRSENQQELWRDTIATNLRQTCTKRQWECWPRRELILMLCRPDCFFRWLRTLPCRTMKTCTPGGLHCLRTQRHCLTQCILHSSRFFVNSHPEMQSFWTNSMTFASENATEQCSHGSPKSVTQRVRGERQRERI